ncbi:hypothetical protein DPMN_060607 [Dreissena polymorpha]|uniref:Uncharacterized protein n=1 Tax=Dreissena polymorpha TaxID=45954 RepID=A0A9D4C662_DREPO|nr:hypothetical protein DPMN_060607 [Dreissena polymorpha]
MTLTPISHQFYSSILEYEGELLPDPPGRPLVAQKIMVQRPSQSLVRFFQEAYSQVRPRVHKTFFAI